MKKLVTKDAYPADDWDYECGYTQDEGIKDDLKNSNEEI